VKKVPVEGAQQNVYGLAHPMLLVSVAEKADAHGRSDK